MKKPISFLSFLLITIVILSIVQVVVSNRISTSGIEIAKLRSKINDYRTQNLIISEKLLIVTSFTNVASGAAEIGFVDNKSQIYLNTPLPLAKQ